MKDLTISIIDRQNVLNNKFAIEKIQTHLDITGMYFNDEYWFTRRQVADFYELEGWTIDRYLVANQVELERNGYRVLKGNQLKEFKTQFGWMLKEGAKAPQLGIFSFRAFLNIGMLLTESEKAKALRSAMLDIVIDVVNQKLGGSTKYINQRDEDFLFAILGEPDYRKEFTNALNNYLDMESNYKYAYYTDAIYKAIFKENAKEYKQVLQLEEKENVRDTMYAEVLNLVASFEIGIADEMKEKFKIKGSKLTTTELDSLITEFAQKRHWIPQIEDARRKMASRDYGLRDIIHDKLEKYINNLTPKEYDKFLGDKSMDLMERLNQNIEVFKRLKDR